MNEKDPSQNAVEQVRAPKAPSSTVATLSAQVNSEVDTVSLAIDWGTFDSEGFYRAIEDYDNCTTPRREIYDGTVKTATGEELEIKANHILKSSNGNNDEFRVDLDRPSVSNGLGQPSKYVSNFDFERFIEGGLERWDMTHRQTTSHYKGQGIATKMLDISEECIRRISLEGMEQCISVDSGQPQLTKWLMNAKRGYQPATQRDADMLDRIISHDETLQEFSAPGDEVDRPAGWIFDVLEFAEKFPEIEGGPANPKVWDTVYYGAPFFYMKSSFKIRVQKALS